MKYPVSRGTLATAHIRWMVEDAIIKARGAGLSLYDIAQGEFLFGVDVAGMLSRSREVADLWESGRFGKFPAPPQSVLWMFGIPQIMYQMVFRFNEEQPAGTIDFVVGDSIFTMEVE